MFNQNDVRRMQGQFACFKTQVTFSKQAIDLGTLVWVDNRTFLHVICGALLVLDDKM